MVDRDISSVSTGSPDVDRLAMTVALARRYDVTSYDAAYLCLWLTCAGVTCPGRISALRAKVIHWMIRVRQWITFFRIPNCAPATSRLDAPPMAHPHRIEAIIGSRPIAASAAAGMTPMPMPSEDSPPVREIPATELKAMMDRGEAFELVDVRTQAERAVAAIPGSRLLDQATYDSLLQLDPEAPIVFHCHFGDRSRAAAEHFRQQGFVNLYNVSDGIDGWSRLVDPTVPRY